MSGKKQASSELKYKKLMNFIFVILFLLVEGIICALMYHAAWNSDINIFQQAALELILIWFGILFGYYAWAVYFYSINFGLTDQDWQGIRKRVDDHEEVYMPSVNPNKDETLGLPKGTVRGSIALTLLVGALAMVIHALGLGTGISDDSFIVDYFDFFKTAFLMMIAFYFGNKSLETLGYKSKQGWSGAGDRSSETSSISVPRDIHDENNSGKPNANDGSSDEDPDESNDVS